MADAPAEDGDAAGAVVTATDGDEPAGLVCGCAPRRVSDDDGNAGGFRCLPTYPAWWATVAPFPGTDDTAGTAADVGAVTPGDVAAGGVKGTKPNMPALTPVPTTAAAVSAAAPARFLVPLHMRSASPVPPALPAGNGRFPVLRRGLPCLATCRPTVPSRASRPAGGSAP
jgi:hypothetical protein